MKMPQPTEEHRKLTRFAGDWLGEETMAPSEWAPEGFVATARHTFRPGLAGFGVIADYEQVRDGEVGYSGHGVWTIDAASGDVVLYWLDSYGAGLETFRGGWKGDVLTVTSRTPAERFRMTYDLSEADTIHSRMETAAEGEDWKPMLDGTSRRAP